MTRPQPCRCCRFLRDSLPGMQHSLPGLTQPAEVSAPPPRDYVATTTVDESSPQLRQTREDEATASHRLRFIPNSWSKQQRQHHQQQVEQQKPQPQPEPQPQPQPEPQPQPQAQAQAQPRPTPHPQPQPQVRVVVENVTVKVNTCLVLDPAVVASKIKNAEYDPEKLPACVMSLSEPQATGLFFKSGNLVVTEATSIEAVKAATRKFIKILETLSPKPSSPNKFTVQNMVGSAEIGYPVNLELMAYLHSRWSMYEPELYPGLIYQRHQGGVVAHVYSSGRVVLAGAKQEDHLNEALERLAPVLQRCKQAE